MIQYKNDSKGKHQSVTASLDLFCGASMYGYEITAHGYGMDEDESKYNLLICINALKGELSKAGAL